VGANLDIKVAPVVLGMVAGATASTTWTSPAPGRRDGCWGGAAKAPSTVARCLWGFTRRHVRQLDALARELLGRSRAVPPARAAPELLTCFECQTST